MKSSMWLLLLAALLFAVPAGAAETLVEPISDLDGCKVWVLCDAETSAQTCGGAGNERFIRAGDAYTFTAWADQSRETDAWTIKIYDQAHGAQYDGTWRTLINSSDMTPSNMKYSWNGLSGDIHAVIGGTLDSQQVTLTIKGCSLSGR